MKKSKNGKTRAKSDLRAADSIDHAVALLQGEFPELTKAIVRKLKKLPAFAAAFKGSRVLLDQFSQAYRTHQAAGVPDPRADTKEGLEERKLRAQAEKIEFEVAEQRGRVVERAKVIASNRRLAGALRKLLRKLETEMPAAVAGKDLLEARDYGTRLHDELLREIQTWQDEWPE